MRGIVMIAMTTASLAAPAAAGISILGSGLGRECFLAAELRREPRSSLEICGRALAESSLDRRDRAATLVNRGILYIYDRNMTLAIRDFDQAIALEPTMAEAHVNRGIALLRKGGADREAIAALSRGLEMKPVRPEVAYYTRAVAYEITGNLQGAYEDYQAAVAANPNWADPQEQLKRFVVERRKAQQG